MVKERKTLEVRTKRQREMGNKNKVKNREKQNKKIIKKIGKKKREKKE